MPKSALLTDLHIQSYPVTKIQDSDTLFIISSRITALIWTWSQGDSRPTTSAIPPPLLCPERFPCHNRDIPGEFSSNPEHFLGPNRRSNLVESKEADILTYTHSHAEQTEGALRYDIDNNKTICAPCVPIGSAVFAFLCKKSAVKSAK